MHASPQFTPAQLIDAGRRAEAEGRPDLAIRFYRHLAEHFGETVEAAEARRSLGRIGAGQSPLWQESAEPQPGAQRALARRPAAARNRYRIGRALASLFSTLGGLLALTGLVALPIYTLTGTASAVLPWVGLLPMAGSAAALVIVGSVVALAGQVARALFDQANATCDLLALERARLGLD